MRKRRIAFQTFGCKLNFSESSSIANNLNNELFSIVDSKEEADYYIINSCIVTNIAEKKCRAAIRQAKRKNKNAVIAVIGCLSQLRADELSNMDEVDIVIGNDNKYQLEEFIKELENSDKTDCKVDITPILKSKKFTPTYSFGDRTRSFLKIQDGCSYFCSYCTIPKARGLSRSGPIKEITQLAREIAEKDIKEIILTGVNIGDYGKPNNESLIELLNSLEEVNGIQRIRISSIEPDLLTEELISFISNSEKVLPHFHIPLQSGSDVILELMNRQYDTALFKERIEMIAKIIPHACIASDVITGFPNETPDLFDETYRFIEHLPLSYVHVFTYSDRPGTVAYKMGNKIDGNIRKDRSRMLQQLSDSMKTEFYRRFIGDSRPVLFESNRTEDQISGFSDNYIRIKTTWDDQLINQIKIVTLKDIDTDGTFIGQLSI